MFDRDYFVFLDEFYQRSGDQIVISAEQGSRFAKEIAGDFNPIHDPAARRFCVPGDLLFSIILAHYGLSQSMSISFSGMVERDLPLNLPASKEGDIELSDSAGKVYTKVVRSGQVNSDESVIEALSKKYVAFSGRNFPYILVPLMKKHGVMFNPKRPLVIYESMSFELESVELSSPDLTLVDSTLDINGKRGDAHFLFDILDGEKVVGRGDKKLIVSGLMPYEDEKMDALVVSFNALKSSYQPI